MFVFLPGNFGCGSAVLAKIAIFAPSFAQILAIANPIPLEAPVTTTVLPLRFPTLWNEKVFANVVIQEYPEHLFY